MRRTGPDSVSSWFIALGCTFIDMILYSVVEGNGVMFVATILKFKVDRQRASMPFILTEAVQAITSPLTGYLAHKFDARVVMAFGCLVSSIGIGACFFAEEIGAFTFFWGVIFGVGFGLTSPLLPVTITHHFMSYRAIAIGFMNFGGYLGLAAFPSITECLLRFCGMSGTFLCISGLMLNCVPVAMLLRKPNYSSDRSRTEAGIESVPRNEVHIRNLTTSVPVVTIEKDCELNRNSDSDSNQVELQRHEGVSKGRVSDGFKLENYAEVDTMNNNALCKVLEVYNPSETSFEGVKKHSDVLLSCESFLINEIALQEKEEHLMVYKNVAETPDSISVDAFSISFNAVKKDKMTTSWSPYSNRKSNKLGKNPEAAITPFNSSSSFRPFKVFLEPVYITVLVAEALFEGSFIAFVTIIIDFSRDIGLPWTDGKYVIMAVCFGSIIGLLSFGWVTDDGHMTLTNFSALLFVCRSITMAAIPFSNGLPVLLVTVLLQGLFEAPHSNLFPLIIADYFSQEVCEVAISCRIFLCAPVYLLIPYLIGYFRDDLGSYFYLFYLMSFCSLLNGVLLCLIPHLAKCRCGRKETILRNRHV